MQADAYKQQMAVGQASRIAGNQANTQFNLRKRTVDAGLNPEALAGEQRRQTLATKPAGAVTPAQLLTMLRAHRNRFQPDIMTGMTREWDPQIIEGERQQLVAGFMAAGMEPPADIMQPTQGVEQQQQQPSVGNFLDSLVGE